MFGLKLFYFILFYEFNAIPSMKNAIFSYGRKYMVCFYRNNDNKSIFLKGNKINFDFVPIDSTEEIFIRTYSNISIFLKENWQMDDMYKVIIEGLRDENLFFNQENNTYSYIEDQETIFNIINIREKQYELYADIIFSDGLTLTIKWKLKSSLLCC